MSEYPEFQKLVTVINALRHPETGCPWDLEQTHQSLLKYLIEESYEYIHAVEENDSKEMEDELGDVLLQVLLHAKIAEESGAFNLESVAKNLKEKMVRRHPHVFSPQDKNINSAQVIENWEQIKKEEKNDQHKSLIDETYLRFPALFSALKIGKKTKKISFDWDHYSQVMYKVEEEWQELKEELAPEKPNRERVKEELGDFLFSAAQLARHLDIDPEDALRQANKKFLGRFQKMETLIKTDQQDILEMNQKEMDHYWDQAKALEKK